MDIPTPSHAVAAFATFMRERLAAVGGTLAPLWARREGGEVLPSGANVDPDAAGPARRFAMVIVGAAAPFAPTSHARARLLRQAHASGLLGAPEAEHTVQGLATSGARFSGGSDDVGANAFGASG
ncbi:MAG: hypothetical protein M3N95_05605 [Actinomycetota bacterium]|nr:hypothetical protein [Actinomycetota bacterium]